MLFINGCVSFGTDLFNHSKGLFFNRALDKLSECQYNMSFHVQKWPDISNGWLDVPSKEEANKKEGKKRWGENRKKRKKRKEEKKKNRKKKGEVTKQTERKGEGRGEEDRMKNRKEKERKKSWD